MCAVECRGKGALGRTERLGVGSGLDLERDDETRRVGLSFGSCAALVLRVAVAGGYTCVVRVEEETEREGGGG